MIIIGSGAIAKKHGQTLRKLAGADFPITVVSRSQANLDAFKSQVGGAVETVREENFAAQKSMSAALIASPPATHLSWIEKLAPVSNLILLEKPAVTSAEEIAAVDRCLDRHPALRLMVAENYDFKPSLFRLHEMAAGKKFGRLKKIVLRKETRQKTNEWKSHCGTLFEGGIHFVALANSLAGAAPLARSVEVDDWRMNEFNVERGSRVRWSCENGVAVELTYAWDRFSPSFGIGQCSHLEFENGIVHFESNGLWIEGRGFSVADVSGSRKMFETFLELANSPQKPVERSSWAKAKKDLELVFEIYLKAGSRVLTGTLAVTPSERQSSNPA